MKPSKRFLVALLAAVGFTAAAVKAGATPHYQAENQHQRTKSMTNQDRAKNAVRQAIDELIQTATGYDTAVLDRIYHDDMIVIMVDHKDNLSTANKEAFINLFAIKRAAGDPPMNTWAKYHHITVDGNKAHVLLARKNDLSGENMHLTLSIDLVFEDNRWQVIREVISLRPDNT